MTEDDKALMSVDLDARLKASMAAYAAKRARKAEIRAEFAEARRHGLIQRHARKLSRIRRESTQPNDPKERT